METYYDTMKRKRLERKAMSGIGQDNLVLTDGSGQQVGTYSQKAKPLQKQAAIKKMKQGKPSGGEGGAGVDAEESIQAGLSTAMQGGNVLDIANSVGKSAIMSQVSGAVKAGSAAFKAAGAKAAATAGASGAAGAAGAKAALAAVNPAVLAGAVGIGLVAGAAARKKKRRMAQAKALEERSAGKQKEAQAFGELSQSIKGMLS